MRGPLGISFWQANDSWHFTTTHILRVMRTLLPTLTRFGTPRILGANGPNFRHPLYQTHSGNKFFNSIPRPIFSSGRATRIAMVKGRLVVLKHTSAGTTARTGNSSRT